MSDDTAEKVMTLAASLAGHGVDNESGGHCGSFVMVKPEQRDEIVSALRSAAAEIERLREEVRGLTAALGVTWSISEG